MSYGCDPQVQARMDEINAQQSKERNLEELLKGEMRDAQKNLKERERLKVENEQLAGLLEAKTQARHPDSALSIRHMHLRQRSGARGREGTRSYCFVPCPRSAGLLPIHA